MPAGPVEQALDRLGWDIARPLDINPAEDAKGRRGWHDLLHAYSNVWVELIRAIGPHWLGRAVAWSTPLWAWGLVETIL